jgi:hypothetical protein
MPPLVRSRLDQTAILWPVSDYDPEQPRQDADGELLVGEPVEIKVRWVDQRTEAVSFVNGASVAFDSKAIVDRDVTVGSLLWLGSFADWYGTGTGGDSGDLRGKIMQVARYRKTPDAKGRTFRRIVNMIRYRDRLPGSVA